MALFDYLKDKVDLVKDTVKTIKSNLTKEDEDNLGGNYCFCSYCGTKLNMGVKFCSNCGKSVKKNDKNNDLNVSEKEISVTKEEKKTNERQQEYIGSVLKCSYCGCAITQTTAICPDCGMKITGQVAVKSVHEFNEQLMLIESKRKRKGSVFSASPTDLQKLALIRSFPVPNTVDDILEFIFLAVANIDNSLSKNNIWNKMSNAGRETADTIGKTISDAWVAKMQQAYQKAKIMFPQEEIFKQIEELYLNKMKELKIKVKE